MSSRKRWWCGGYGTPHYIPGSGRGFLVCCRCRWNPNYREPIEERDALIKASKKEIR